MDRSGPSNKTLRALFGMLPSFTKGVIEKSVTGKGRAVEASRRPRKNCPVCLAAWDWAPLGDEFQLQAELCERCEGLLKDGYIAFVCGDEFAFAKHPHLADMAGTVQRIQPETFAKIRGNFEVQKRGPNPAPEA